MWVVALLIRVFSSVGVRSLIERKWRGVSVVEVLPGWRVESVRDATRAVLVACMTRGRDRSECREAMLASTEAEKAHEEQVCGCAT